MQKSYYIIYDTETGGLDKTKNPITQFACIVIDPKTLKEVDRLEMFIKSYNNLTITTEALEHTMVTMSDIKSGVSVEDFVNVLIEFFELYRVKTRSKEAGRLVPIGHNIPFDNGFLDYAFNLCKKNFYNYIYENFIDTYTLAKMTWGIKGDEKLTLGACCERAKIGLNDAHGAMNDVEATTDLFRWFTKKLRNDKNEKVSVVKQERSQGKDFFEFKCGAK